MNKEPDVRWPAEWEPQDAVWLSWPHRRDLWQGGLDELQQTYGSVAAAIAPHALVCVNAAAPLHPGVRQAMLAAGVSEEQFRLFNHPTNDVWCRDHGPVFVQDVKDGSLMLADWQFNAWGGKFPVGPGQRRSRPDWGGAWASRAQFFHDSGRRGD